MSLRKRYAFPMFMGLLMALIPAFTAGAASSPTVVTSHLQGPRSVAFINGRAVVSESGTGGAAPNCFTTFLGPTCVGPTSQVTWVDLKTGAHSLLAGGFFSLADPNEALGVSGLAVLGHTLYAQISATSREIPSTIPAGQPNGIGQQAGQLLAINPDNGSWRTVASVGASDFDWTTQFPEPTPQDGSQTTCRAPLRNSSSSGGASGLKLCAQEHDANPTGLLASGDSILVADSGANLIDRVSRSGNITRLHYFPNRYGDNFPSDEVPTCIARADDGLWVGTLAGHLFLIDEDGSAKQVSPKDRNGTPLLTHVTGCTTSEDGTLYLVQMFGSGVPFRDRSFFNGSIVTYQPESGRARLFADTASAPTLFLPYSARFGPDGNLYVVAGAICGADGSGPPGCTAGDAVGGRLLKFSIDHHEDNQD